MASNVSVTYNFVAGTAAVADEVDTNFNDIVSWVNTNAVHLDGSKAFTGIPSGPSSNPTTANQFARKAYVDSIAGLPIGGVAMWAGPTAPTGYLLCQGQAVNRGDYVDLFTIIGTTYGAGNGTTTFNLPNLQGRVAVGRDAAQTEFDALGETGGSKTNTLLEANLPAHFHTIAHDHPSTSISATVTINADTTDMVYRDTTLIENSWVTGLAAATTSIMKMNGGSFNTLTGMTVNYVNDHTHTGTVSGTVDLPNFTGDSGPVGSGTAVNNLQPYIVLNYIIRAI